MAAKEEADAGVGCLLLIAVAFIGFGAGHIWGGAIGLIAAGIAILFLAMISSR